MASSMLSIAAKSISGPQSSIAQAIDHLPTEMTNVSGTGRWASLVGGAALIGSGVSHRGTTGLLSMLGGAFLVFRGATGHCPISQAMRTSTSNATGRNSVIAAGHGTRVEARVVVKKPAAEVYRFWRDFENLPKFMDHLLDVDTTTDGQSRWRAKAPLGMQVQWEAKLIADEPNRLIAWKSLPGSDIDTTGSVHFTELPDSQGTEIRVELKYNPPAGRIGTAIAKLFGEDPQNQIQKDLERFRQLMDELPIAT